MPALKQSRGPSTSVATIVNHPLRSRVWIRLVERPASPAQMAREFGCAVNDVAYHCDVLAKLGVIEEVGQRPVRGATEHFWRSVARPEITKAESENMDAEDGISHATTVTQTSFADVALSLDSGKLVERPEHAVLRFPLTLDEQGWAKIADAYEELKELIYETEGESKLRLRDEPERESLSVTALAFLFEKPVPTA